MPLESPTPSASATLLPFLGGRSRRASLASISSRNGEINKDLLSRTLDTIHTSASRSAALTSFHDFDGGVPRAGPKELVSGSVSGFYNRLKQSVGVSYKASPSSLVENNDNGLGLSIGPDASLTQDRPLSSSTRIQTTPEKTAKSLQGPRVASSAPSISHQDVTQTEPPFSPSVDLYRSTPGPIPDAVSVDVHQSSDDEAIESRPLTTLRHFDASEEDLGSIAAQALAKVISHQDMSVADRSLKYASSTSPELSKLSATSDQFLPYGKGMILPSLRVSQHGSEFPSFDATTAVPSLNETRPPMRHIGVSHLPGFEPSRTSSTTDLGEGTSSSSATTSRQFRLDPSPNLNGALQRKRSSNRGVHSAPLLANVPAHLKRRVISKEFWMKDENARDCFSCGQAFSTFRRKHHCRTCGQIFDSKCTTLVPGRPFGQPGTLRLCRPCEAMVYGDDDDSTVFTEDGDDRSPVMRASHAQDLIANDTAGQSTTRIVTEPQTPSIGIPVSRRQRESKRRSAVIEFDAQPSLGRPSSAHSLISLSRRARSSSHRRHQSRFSIIKGGRGFHDDRVPFHQDSTLPEQNFPSLPAFHHDNVIDPDLAPFLSDQGSDDEDHPSIMSAFEQGTSPAEKDRSSLNGFVTASAKKARPRTGDRATATSSIRGVKESDPGATGNRNTGKLRNRNGSVGSMTANLQSARLGRADMNFKNGPLDEYNNMLTSTWKSTRPVRHSILRSSSMRGAAAPSPELNAASLDHVRRMLSQLLKDAGVESLEVWSKALMPILLQCTDDVEPDVPQGDDMDVRHYVKMKKIPDGRPGDTCYVSGVVFSKNVALKSMPTSLSFPRIVIITFSIEYARHETHFLSLEPVIAQEREYLRNLVSRIAALNPQLLLVQKNVSGLALDLLHDAGITVVFNIKESVLAAVARVTQSPMIKSVDKLTMDPSHLGRCQRFDVKTYLHGGVRKTYIFLSGCLPDLGCTIILRGSDTKTLRTIKRITEFMCYVVYNLKLETSLMRDEFVSIPQAGHDQLMPLDPRGKAYCEEEGKSGSIPGLESPDTPCKYGKIEEAGRKRILSASPFVVFMQPYVLTQLREQEGRLARYRALRKAYAEVDVDGDESLDEKDPVLNTNFELVRPEMIHISASRDQPRAVREYLHAVHEAQLEKAVHTFATQKRLWESFTSTSSDPFDPLSHQTIVVLSSTVSSITSAPCYGPELIGIEFYSSYNHVQEDYEEDCTLGQYIEDLCAGANNTCGGCGKKMYDHSRQYVHGHGQLSISIQKQASKLKGYADKILMWSSCRKCQQETTVMPMSENSWKYSFAKYLELSFWSSPLHPRASLCQHDIHKDFLRCFELSNMIIRVQYDTVDIYDVIVPRSIITWKVEADLIVKNGQYTIFAARLHAFVESVNKRLDSITLDALEEKKIAEAHETLNNLRLRIKDDHRQLLSKLQQKYADSRYYELIPLNRALRFMDEKAIEWDEAFAEFENDYFPSETDIRKLAVLQLKNMFLESQPATSSSGENGDFDDSTEMKPFTKPSTSAEKVEKQDLPSEKAHNVMSTSIDEHREVEALRNDTDGKDASPLQTLDNDRIASPWEEHEQAVDRDEVRHLDLAVAQITSDEARTVESSGLNGPDSPETGRRSSNEDNFAIQPKPLSSGLLERIEQIRSKRTPETDVSESKIPRLADLQKRESLPAPPPLLRAQSHPAGMSPRSGPEDPPDPSSDVFPSKAPVVEAPSMLDRRLGERLGVARLVNKVGKVAPSLIPRSIPLKLHDDPHYSSVSALARHFEQLSREFENQRLRERRQRALRSRQARANPLASSRPVVEVYSNANDAVGDQRPEKPVEGSTRESSFVQEELTDRPTSRHSTSRTVDTNEQSQEDADTISVKPEQPSSDEKGSENNDVVQQHAQRPRQGSDPASALSSTLVSPSFPNEMDLPPELTIPEHKKNVWFKYLADFWSKRSASGWAPLEYPLYGTEHVFEDSDIIVREDEPSSVIALSLACADYQNKAKTFRSQACKGAAPRHGHSSSQNSNLDASVDAGQSAVEASLLSDTGTHMKYSFSHGQVKASCKIFYAEAFDALRRRCMVADRFVESLSRCLKYDSKGGKTKSLFLKTLDNRFIIKSLQEVELKAFNKFAPDYFAFMSYTLFHGVPSVIAKMLGLFQVTIKNPGSGMDFSYYLLVMENLFYERNPNRRFDLKGSMRNRKIESTGQPDEVLLDENLVETIFESPLFVREHARKLLQASVYNDTMWLCKQNVMDYSLMAGFDDERKELVVGIIDCIRTYTWDKKLESWIKDRGKNKPTITSPKDYRNRFRVSMMQYVLQAPSCWHQFQAQMVPPKTLRDREDGGEETDPERKLDVM